MDSQVSAAERRQQIAPGVSQGLTDTFGRQAAERRQQLSIAHLLSPLRGFNLKMDR